MLPRWVAHPAGGTMAIMLLFGTAFIIGHHFFYQSLSGKPPPNAVYFSGFAGGLTGQQLNLAAGSAFAFLVVSSLGVVITTAANQALWVAVRTKPSKLEVIDNLATATTNIWNLFDFRLWKKSPVRMTLVTIFWYEYSGCRMYCNFAYVTRLLSVISFLTPATLNIRWSISTAISTVRVPQVDFTSLNFAEIQGEEEAAPDFRYFNPQYSVLQVVAESTAGGHILPILSPHQNATWALKFPGPALSCENLDNSSALYDTITNNILVTMSAGIGENVPQNCAYSFGYISWVPEAPVGTSDVSFLPFPGMSMKSNHTLYGPPLRGVGPIYASPATEPLTLFIAALPGMRLNDVDYQMCIAENSTSFSRDALDQVANMTITRCTMYNTSYVANFTYIDNIQSIELATQGSFNNITGQWGVDDSGAASYRIGGDDKSGYKLGYNVSVVETFAYQAIMDAFGRMFVGTIAYDSWQGRQIIDTQMALTPLLNTNIHCGRYGMVAMMNGMDFLSNKCLPQPFLWLV
jgi:hypothetical protein